MFLKVPWSVIATLTSAATWWVNMNHLTSAYAAVFRQFPVYGTFIVVMIYDGCVIKIKRVLEAYMVQF